MRGFSALDVMTLRTVRDASEAGAGIAALDLSLSEIVWANGAGQALLGLSRTDGELSATSAQGRQVRAAGRMIDARGEARILLRPAAGFASKPVVTDLKRIAAGGRDLVLLTARGMRRAETSDPALAERLLSESGLEDAAIYSPNGVVTAASGFPEDVADAPLSAVATFIEADEESRAVDGGGYAIVLSRVATSLVLVRREIVAPIAAGQEEAARPAEPAVGTPGRTAGLFSVKRQKLPASRGAISMSALVQRWHRRQDDSDGPSAAASVERRSASEGDDAALHDDDAASTERDARSRGAGAVQPSGESLQPAAERDATPASREGLGEEPGFAVGRVADPAFETSQSTTDGPAPAPAAAILRSRWGAPTEDAADAPIRDENAVPLMLSSKSSSMEGEPTEAVAPVDTRLGSDEPAGPREEPAVKDAPVAVPNDLPAGTDGEAGQPVEKESVIIFPDVPAEDAPGLDVPISDDAEVPDGETMVPQTEEATPTDLAVAGNPKGEFELPVSAPAPGGARRRFEPRFDVAPVRFVWQIDREGRFHSLSPEFADAVGPKAAEVAGFSFREVANVFGFDVGGEIARLLDRRDTWSGRSVLWPVEASDRKVPIDLAALPVYARDRSFDGFRGFGIVKMNEAVVDPDAVGLLLADHGDRKAEAVPAAALAEPAATDQPRPPAARPLIRTFEADPPGTAFGRRSEPPQPSSATASDLADAGLPAMGSDNDGEPKVIRLEERRRPRDGMLSQAEEAAFRAIGVKLGQRGETDGAGVPRSGNRANHESASRQSIDGSQTIDATPLHGPMTATSDQTAKTSETASIGEAAPGERADHLDALSMPADMLAASGAERAGTEEHSGTWADLKKSGGLKSDVDALHGRAVPNAPAGNEASAPSVIPEDDDASKQPAPSVSAAPPPTDERSPRAEDADVLDEDGKPAGRAFDAVATAGELEAIFASLPLPVLVQMQETLLYANREFEDLSGYASLDDLEAAGGLDALFVEREDGLKAGELAIRRSNGQVADVRVHMQRVTFSGRSALLMSFSPSPRASAAAAQPAAEQAPVDLSAAHELDDLRQEIEELQAVLDTATDGVVLLDPAGSIRAMNGSAHALFGGGLSEHAGRHLSSLFAHESQKATHDYLEMLRDDGLAGILNDGREVIGRVAQGGFIPLFITIGRLSGDRGWCVVMRDIAHWKRIEEDLVNARRQAEAASLHKSRFLANISHELRTPLNAIIGFADVMASECFGPIGNERYLEYLGDIKRSGHHVLDLVNDLLDISKIEAGKLDLAFEAVSLNEVVAEVVSLMQPQANRERVIVRSNLPSSVPPVVADRRTMRQIALNLVANAIRFTPAGGQIIASTTYTVEGDVLLRFRDSGIGMTEREIEIALTPFQQVHAPSLTRGEGTGLGLPLTKAMAEANRAAFAIHSVPGEGTLVEITFPSQRVLAD